MTTIREASLILTVLNEEGGLPGFLASLSRQSTLPSEIVVVDGGSTDETVALLRAWAAPAGCVVRVEERVGAGISEGRNLAIEVATHDMILVTDGGTLLDPFWIETMADGFAASGDVDVVSGWFRPVGTSFVERAIAFTVTPILGEIDPGRFLPSSRSVAFHRSAWLQAGGYPEWLDYCEDLVFDLALKRAGMSFVFAPNAVVTWSARSKLRSFMKQYYRYARGDGKAGLWPRRHVIRYATYIGSTGLLIASLWWPWLLGVVAIGFVAYMRKFWSRVVGRRGEFGKDWPCAIMMVPVIVVVGDVAKMCGYPAGIRWRRMRSAVKEQQQCTA